MAEEKKEETKKEIKIEYINLSELKENEYNPKMMTEKEAKDLEQSIVKFGIVDPLIVNSAEKRKGILIGGHQRYKLYQRLKYEKVPVVYVDIPDLEKEKELCIRLSRNTGQFDFDLLANFSGDLLKDIGFDDFELSRLTGEDEDSESLGYTCECPHCKGKIKLSNRVKTVEKL